MRKLKMKTTGILLIIVVSIALYSCENLLLEEDAKPHPPQNHESRLAYILDSLRYALELPALAGAIVTDKGIIDAQAIGCRRYGGACNIQKTDKFHLGSCGKVFTSVLMGTYVDEGLISWNTTLKEVFPEHVNVMRNEYKDVTIKQLLSHSAGLIRDRGFTLTSQGAKERRAELVPLALSHAPAQQRGKYLYSNIGYSIAGAIIEKISGRNYEELMIERVLLPLGLTTAGFGPMGTPGKEDQPLQHTPLHAPLVPTADAQLDLISNPAGGLHMSVEDWAKFVQWTLTVEAGGHQDLLKDETAKVITTGVVIQAPGWMYALGWGAGDAPWAGGKALQHMGSNGFNYSTAMLSAKKHFGIIIMTNQGAVGDEWLLGPVFYRLLKYYEDEIE